MITMPQRFLCYQAFPAIGLALFLFAGQSTPSPALAQDGQGSAMPMMNCPMMTGLKGIELTADSPPLLMANAEELELTQQQRQRLQEIAKEAREKARQVLTAEQRDALGEAADKPKPMMKIAMTRAQKVMQSDQEDSKKMCPMCMRMMKNKMGNQAQQRN